MKRFVRLSAPLAGALALCGTASAATITFTDHLAIGADLSVSAEGTQVTASAATFDVEEYDEVARMGRGVIDPYGPHHDGAFLTVSPFGLALSNSIFDDHQIDGTVSRDVVTFSFDEAVTLTELTFSFVDESDDFVLFVGDEAGELSAFSLVDVMMGEVALNVTGRAFGVGAFDHTDAFKLTGLSFEAAAVPLPAAAPLFAGALALGGLARRRRAA